MCLRAPMTSEDHTRFGDVRSLIAREHFRAAHRVAYTIAHPDLRERAEAHIEAAIAHARSNFDALEPALRFDLPSDDDAARMLRTFYPECPPETAMDDPIQGDAILVLSRHASPRDASPRLIAHALLRRLSTRLGTQALFKEVPYAPPGAVFEEQSASEIAQRIRHLLVHGLLLETPWMDDRPDDATRIARDIPSWLGSDATFLCNTLDGCAYHPVAHHEDWVLDELIIGVGATRIALFWAFGYS